jgi:hypothetical protein
LTVLAAVYQAARTTQLKMQYKTVDTPFGATKRSKKHSVSGTARKKTLKDIAKTTIAKS